LGDAADIATTRQRALSISEAGKESLAAFDELSCSAAADA
jgi:hypothetical protein